MADTTYRNVDIPLDAVVTDLQRSYIPGAEPGSAIFGAYVVPQNFTDAPLPPGAQVKLYFGQNDEVIMTLDTVAFKFPCGHSEGIFFSNAVALPGKKVRLLLDYSGFGVTREQ